MSVIRWRRILSVGITLGLTAGIIAFLIARQFHQPVAVSSTQPTTAPSIVLPPPATQPTVTTYMDVIRLRYPNFPATRPFDLPAELSQAGHLIIDDPVYVSPRGDLWITRPDAPPLDQVLTTADTEHVVNEQIAYVHWNGDLPTAIVPRKDGGWDLVDLLRRRPLPWHRNYHWDAAQSWNDQIIVPTDQGVSIITISRILAEDYHQLLSSPSSVQPQIAFDNRGILAWIPPDGTSNDGHIARYVDNQWTVLSGNGWESRPVHLVPLLDGSVLQFVARPDGTLKIEPVNLEATPVDSSKIDDFIDQLGDDDPDKRAAAYAALSQYGPGIWTQLESHVGDPDLDITTRIHLLLLGKLKPTLGGMSLVSDDLILANRFPGGGAVLYTGNGVIAPFAGPDESPATIKSAWISLAPGEPAQLLPTGMTQNFSPPQTQLVRASDEWAVPGKPAQAIPPGTTQNLSPSQTQLVRIGDEWIALDDAGPRRFLSPSSYLPLLRDSEKSFTHLLTIDRRGRWLFQRPNSSDQTLIIDPNLPDPAPRLLVWLPDATGSAGWDNNDWPVMARQDQSWLLKETDWFPVDLVHDRVTTQWPPRHTPAATQPTTPILHDAQGNTWYDGLTQLIRVSPDGSRQQWPLPPEAAAPPSSDSSGTVAQLVETKNGLLYLFNASARVVRIRPTPGESSPFRIEGVFKKGIPFSDQIERIWLDPAGRIDIVYTDFGKARLALLFADGEIPPELQRWIMPKNLRVNGAE